MGKKKGKAIDFDRLITEEIPVWVRSYDLSINPTWQNRDDIGNNEALVLDAYGIIMDVDDTRLLMAAMKSEIHITAEIMIPLGCIISVTELQERGGKKK